VWDTAVVVTRLREPSDRAVFQAQEFGSEPRYVTTFEIEGHARPPTAIVVDGHQTKTVVVQSEFRICPFRFGVDQIRYAFESLSAQPHSRQVVLQIWDASSDLPVHAGQPRSQDIPCNICSLLKVREGRLEWTQIMRSNDLKLSWPHNIVQFTTLQEMMAAWLDLELGFYTHYSDSLHVYTNETNELAGRCTNPLLRQLWHREHERRQREKIEADGA
jgi:thymidylate synthase